ncbi:MAG: glycosyltransferase family 2 protein [Daejeonella sp.]
MKISLITVTYNAAEFLEECIQSVINQTYKNLQYIIVDGGSTDKTISIINKYKEHISVFISEPDKGIYDAMNKGIKSADGDVVGILNADDFFADQEVLSTIANEFESSKADIVYGDLWYISRDNLAKVTRKWISGDFKRFKMQFGWMPAHPTFYAKKALFDQYGLYDLSYKTAADYDLMLRFLYKQQTVSSYVNKVFVKMRTGGVSNKLLINRFNATLNDRKAMENNGISFSWLLILMKPFRKIEQFFN